MLGMMLEKVPDPETASAKSITRKMAEQGTRSPDYHRERNESSTRAEISVGNGPTMNSRSPGCLQGVMIL